MEPFFIRCETCRARLRVRDERFLGQVQSCPKCGSMVHIIAPAGWLAAGDAAATPQEVVPTVVAETTAGSLLTKPIVLWSAGGAAFLLVGSLVGAMTLGGDERTVVATPPPVVQVKEDLGPTADDEPVAEVSSEARAAVEDVADDDVETSKVESATDAFFPLEPVVAPTPEPSQVTAPKTDEKSPRAAETRTLTLEVIAPPRHVDSTEPATAKPPAEYPAAMEVDTALSLNSRAERPDRLTNIDDQLAMSIDSIELPPMPIVEFVNMISNMSAVPIRLDPKVLGDVGHSTRTKVVVKGGDITLRELLDRVLKEHDLACDERDGELVVVRAKR